MFSDKVLAHFREPHNAGDLVDASQIAEVTNPVCGDVLRLAVRVEDGKIVAARFKAQGCVPAIAAASALTDMLVGKTPTEARGLTPSEIAAALDGLPEASGHAAELCCDAVAALKTP
jgi:nitrogen fixation protein NifU and related proteins